MENLSSQKEHENGLSFVWALSWINKWLLRDNNLSQFEKIELVKFVHPNESEKALDELVSHASKILDKLELSYRKVVLCSGDLGFSAAKTFHHVATSETFKPKEWIQN